MADLNLTDQERAILLSGGTLPDARLDEIAAMSGGAAAPTGAGVPVGLTPSGEIDLLQVAKQLRSQQPESEEMQSQTPDAGVWDYIKAGASGTWTGAKGSVGSIFSMLGALPGQIADLPENISAISRYGELTPEQQEAVKQGMVQAGKQMIPGYNYMQQVTTPEERANLEQLAKYSLLQSMVPGSPELLGVTPPEQAPSLGTLVPQSPQEMEALGEEAGALVGPGAALKTGKLAVKGAGKVLDSELLEGLANIGRNTEIELTKKAKGTAAAETRLNLPFATTDAGRQLLDDALPYEDIYKRESGKIFKDVQSSPEQWRENPKLFEKIVGKTTEAGKKEPGVFRKYINEFKDYKKTVSDQVDTRFPKGLAVKDIDVNRLNALIKTYEKNSFTKESLGLAESGLEKFESDLLKSLIVDKKGNPLKKEFSGLTMNEANKYIRQIDDELRKIGYYDDKTYRSITADPSVAAKVRAEGESLREIRRTLQDSQQKAITDAIGPDAAAEFQEANRKIAMAIEYENLWRRFMFQTLEQVVKPTGSSLNTSVRTGGKVGRMVESGVNAIEAITPGGDLRKALRQQRQAVQEAKDISAIYTGQTPGTYPRDFSLLSGIDTSLSPEQRAITAAAPQVAEFAAQEPTAPSLIEALGAQGKAMPPMPEATTTTMPPTTTTMGGAPGLTMPTEEEGFEAPEAPMGAAAAAAVGAAMPTMPEGPMQLPVDTGLFTAPPKPFTPIKPSTDTILDSFNDLAPQLQQILPPEESMNVLDTLNQAIQSKSDDALGRTVTAMLKQYPEARTLFVDEFPDMPIFTFNKKIYQEDDKRAFEKIINDSKASSIAKSKSLSALNRDGSVIMPR